MTAPSDGTVFNDVPPLAHERRLDAVGIFDEAFQTGLEEQQHELGVELEAQRVPERGLDRETAQIIGVATELPEHDGAA
jgi:hypothetical protein